VQGASTAGITPSFNISLSYVAHRSDALFTPSNPGPAKGQMGSYRILFHDASRHALTVIISRAI
jgi:hypothetical protein